MKTTKKIPRIDEERIYEGLRIPGSLDSTADVNFVLTQEPGKLKPKDLKAAIERNRADREARAAEQRQIREEGGGAGLLDLRGILAEERLNSNESDPFKRQLREMAFLADVEEVQRQETEKTFRISEDFYGSNLLTEDDILTVKQQREKAALNKKRGQWRKLQARQHTGHYPPRHAHIKAGASDTTSHYALEFLAPHFDSNRNDIWTKRLNTLQWFLALVSRYIIRKRVSSRMRKLVEVFHNNEAYTREQVLDYIQQENTAYKKLGKANTSFKQSDKESSEETKDSDETPQKLVSKYPSVAAMVFEEPNPRLVGRSNNERIISQHSQDEDKASTARAEMVRRILFPKCVPDNGGKGSRKTIDESDTAQPICFDDRTVFPLKVRPDFITYGYRPQSTPVIPVFYPMHADKALRQGAAEENLLRPPADQSTTYQEAIQHFLADTIKESPALTAVRKAVSDHVFTKPVVKQPDDINTFEAAVEDLDITPPWLQRVAEGSDCAVLPKWSREEVQFMSSTSSKDAFKDYRVFSPSPLRCELDDSWLLRPNSEQLVYARDSSLRTCWMSKAGGFLSANTYLLAGHESICNTEVPAPTPTLSDYYMPDIDRHASGLNCFRKDHLRGVVETDLDMLPLQHRQDKADYLTDSESDDEDGYGVTAPSMQQVRKLLKRTSNETTLHDSAVESDFELKADERREEQVELLRDRKILDLENTLLKQRKDDFDGVVKELVQVSIDSTCPLQAVPVQVPFHIYEEDVYKLMIGRIAEYPMTNVQPSASASRTSAPSSPQKSPQKV